MMQMEMFRALTIQNSMSNRFPSMLGTPKIMQSNSEGIRGVDHDPKSNFQNIIKGREFLGSKEHRN